MKFEPAHITEVAEFRKGAARSPGQPIDELCNMRDDPDEPNKKTLLMKIACELLLRAGDMELCKAILAGVVFVIPDDTWLDSDPQRRRVRRSRGCRRVHRRLTGDRA
jgi:hypothetical protein